MRLRRGQGDCREGRAIRAVEAFAEPLFAGVHIGLSGLYGVCLKEDGTVLSKAHQRFSNPEEMGLAYDRVVGQLQKSEAGPVACCLALEKPHRLVLAPRRAAKDLKFPPQIVQPALSAVLLGAIPGHPGLLISLGKEVRFALIDSTLSYREYRINEGGGAWWQGELMKLSQHSQRLTVHLKNFEKSTPPLREISRLLELGTFPTPDPVLKPRLEKVAGQLSDMALTLSSRLPGIRSFAMSGFLADSALGRLLAEKLLARASHLRWKAPRFPPEVGAALSTLALKAENWERGHLGKPPFEQDRSIDEWTPPQVLIRRLYRLRKPFEEYS